MSDKTGFSKVYEAYEQNTPKILKILKEDLSGDAKAVELFQQEVTVLEQLNHPGIPKEDSYFQYQTRNGLVLHCIAMEKIAGYNLEQWLKQQNCPISQEQAIDWLRQLIEILDVVHGKKYLHRDIKPSNIMIKFPFEKGWGNLVLIDFGTATEITQTYQDQLNNSDQMTALMSSGYSAPEQMNGQAAPQSDFFALGRTFVFLLTGYHPLEMYDVQHNLLHWQNHAIHISPLLLNLIDKLTASDIEKRPANTQEILHSLEEIETQFTEINLKNTNTLENSQIEHLSVPINNNLSAQSGEILPSASSDQKEQGLKTSSEKEFRAAKSSGDSTSDDLVLLSPSIPTHKQPEKVPLLAFFAVMLLALGLLSIVTLATQKSDFSEISNYRQYPEKKGNVDYFDYKAGRDSQGRVAEFNIAVLSVEYKWLLGSNFQIKYNDEIISLNLLNLNLEQGSIKKIMEAPREIISVGTASCKGDTPVQERVALERSKQIQVLVKKLFINTPSVKGYRLLNLGQFQRSECKETQDITTYQRSIIIIGVKKESSGVILDEALRDRLEKKPFADFKLEDYSLGSAQKFKTIPSNL
nr:serine/threonine-protein kinase [Nostoc flagelliforme]